MKKLFLSLLTFTMIFANAQEKVFPIYPDGVPNSKQTTIDEKLAIKNSRTSISDVTNPTLTVFTPDKSKNSGAAVIICPGGGYSGLAFTHEGTDVGKLFASWGITAFVLKYRLPNDEIMNDKSIGPLQDAQRAIQLVRERAAEWKIDTAKIGIMGFSAGGHLASTASTHFTTAVIDNPKSTSLRPSFSILCYPVISFADSIGHRGSRENLIGKNASADKIALYSNELQVTAQTPPAFLLHAEDDNVVPVENTLYYYQALLKNKVPAEMHIYPKGGHGFGLKNPTTQDEWSERLHNWMKGNGWAK